MALIMYACTIMLITALFTTAGTRKQPQCTSTEEQIKKMCVCVCVCVCVYTHKQWHPLQYSCLENPMDGGAW